MGKRLLGLLETKTVLQDSIHLPILLLLLTEENWKMKARSRERKKPNPLFFRNVIFFFLMNLPKTASRFTFLEQNLPLITFGICALSHSFQLSRLPTVFASEF